MVSPPLETTSGRRLLALLPEVYRNRDADGHLAAYLDACGALLDGIYNLLSQRLADSFPDNPTRLPAGPDGVSPPRRACQDWLLPYFARLFDLNLVSPHVEGRREEVANAVRWRQRKGTAIAIEEIAEAIGRRSDGRSEVELHEGFRRVATTARIGWPLFPAWAWGERREPDRSAPQDMATHPGLAAVTVDVRRPSRAIRSDPANPAAKRGSFDGVELWWRQHNRHGAPCFPGSFDDVSRRTVDFRTPDAAHGRFHSRRVLIFHPPPTGFFRRNMERFNWADRANHPEHFQENTEGAARTIRNPSGSDVSVGTAVLVDGDPDAFVAADRLEISQVNFAGTVTVDAGRLVLRQAAFKKIVINNAGAGTEPVLDARDCLFDDIEADGWVRLVGCTVMKRLTCVNVQASDCLLPDVVRLTATSGPPGCVRYSRVPEFLLHDSGAPLLMHKDSMTAARPVYADVTTCVGNRKASSTAFGNLGYGVLDPATPESIASGGEMGGEMGAFGHLRHCLQRAAVREKLGEYLPLGIEAVLIADPRLLQAPHPEPQA